jgi:hypothetical protein
MLQKAYPVAYLSEYDVHRFPSLHVEEIDCVVC